MDRRNFLKLSMATAGASWLSFGSKGWAATNPNPSGRRLVVVFLRGAVDGLNVVVPYTEENYYDSRPTIAIQRPGQSNGAFDLDGRFGLHPALQPLMPFWKEGSLAFIHACGSPDPTRSHFDAQDYMESGVPGRKGTPDGWMNRLLVQLPGQHTPTSALSFGPTLPRIYSGKMSVANIPLGRAANRPMPVDRPAIHAAFDRLYSGNDALSRAYKDGMESRQKLLADLQQDMTEADNGAPSPVGFADDTGHLAKLMAQDSSVELAFFALGGWDTHINQGSSGGQLAGHLKSLAEGLAQLGKDLGSHYRDTVILVMSEFGRTVRENGNRGTDHGHGNVIWAMGGPVTGGKIYGVWPGLSDDQLYEGRDLAVTTDFRSAIGLVLSQHLHLDQRALALTFPDMPAAPSGSSGLIRS